MDCRLKHVVIVGFKSLKRIDLDGLGNLALFMGRNNAGKSNILDAFRFIAEAALDFDEAVRERGGKFTEIVFRKHELGKIEFTFEFELSWPKRTELITRLFKDNKNTSLETVLGSNFLSTITLKLVVQENSLSEELSVSNLPPDTRSAIVFLIKSTRQTVEATAGNLDVLCARCSSELPPDAVTLPPQSEGGFHLRLGKPEKTESFPVSSEIANLIEEQFSSLEWIDPLRRLPSSAPIKGGTVIAHDASNLPDVLHWLHNNKPKSFRRIETEVAKLVPQLGHLYTPTFQNAATLGLIDSEDEDLVFSMDQMSFGTRSLIAIIAKVVTAKNGSWVCVEEPETYLHPQAQIGLFRFLHEESARCRIFLATHSTFIAASCPVQSLFVVQRDRANSTVVSPVVEANAIEVIEQLGVKPSFSFEADAIVFVESEAAVSICQAWAKKVNVTANAQFIDVEGGCTLHYYANTRVASSKFVHTLVYAIFGGGAYRGELGRRIQKSVVTHLDLPEMNVATLTVPEMESFVLDAKAFLKVFPKLELSEPELATRFESILKASSQMDAIRKFFEEYRLGDFDAAVAGRLAEAMDAVPARLVEFFQQIDNDSKPFWKI